MRMTASLDLLYLSFHFASYIMQSYTSYTIFIPIIYTHCYTTCTYIHIYIYTLHGTASLSNIWLFHPFLITLTYSFLSISLPYFRILPSIIPTLPYPLSLSSIKTERIFNSNLLLFPLRKHTKTRESFFLPSSSSLPFLLWTGRYSVGRPSLLPSFLPLLGAYF